MFLMLTTVAVLLAATPADDDHHCPPLNCEEAARLAETACTYTKITGGICTMPLLPAECTASS